MLHEILLSLSGLPSPIWDQIQRGPGPESHGLADYVSPPETAMLQTLAHLSELHSTVRDAAGGISTSHPSMVCRAVSATMTETHLGAFRKEIVRVESSILQKDAGYVGGYGIVPLSTIVADFTPWTRRLEWLRSVLNYILAESPTTGRSHPCVAADILNFLEKEAQTGYSDIEEMATVLLSVGQRAWMRTVATWLLYGRLPPFGKEDFCVQQHPEAPSPLEEYSIDPALVPDILNGDAAEALLATGSALNQLRFQRHSSLGSCVGSSEPVEALLPRHLNLLESLSYPLNASLLSNVLASINQSMSENVLSQLLPHHRVIQLLDVIQDYVLLGHGEFAVLLIAHADDRVADRQRSHATARPVRKVGRIDDLAIKDTELKGIMSKTWAELASVQRDEEMETEVAMLAKRLLALQRLIGMKDAQAAISTLLPTPTVLSLTLPPSSSLSLFISSADIQTYAIINAYLLSIRRAGIHLASLWQLSPLRRGQPAPVAPSIIAARRTRDWRRMQRTRGHWACASKTLFVLSELGAYFHGEVVERSWQHFRRWINGKETEVGSSAVSSRPGTASSAAERPPHPSQYVAASSPLSLDPAADRVHQRSRDPRALAAAHRACLQALNAALLLDNQGFLKVLKTLLNLVDHYVALFSRLQSTWQGLDLQDDDGVVDAFSNYAQDEKDVLVEMDRTRDVMEKVLVSLVDEVKEVEKDPDARSRMVTGMTQLELSGKTFVAWKGRTIDRLVMKLDSLTGMQEDKSGYHGYDRYDRYDDE